MGRLRNVDRHKYADYLKRAEELLNAMNRAYESGEWNACVINAVQSAIASADALCIFKKGVRHAGERHEEALMLFSETEPDDLQVKSNAKHLAALLSIKTDAEYGERLMNRRDAEQAKLDAGRLFSFVKGKTASVA